MGVVRMSNWLLARTYVKHRRIGVGSVLAPEHNEIGQILTSVVGRNVESMTDDEVLAAFKPAPASDQYSKYKAITASKESENE